jgi:hypothetical protein
MEGGHYRVDLEITPRFPILTEDEEHTRADRMNVYLPAGDHLVDDRFHPEFGSADLVVEVTAPSPAEALAEVARALEHLSIKIRQEHDKDPLGPMPILRRAIITHTPGDEDGAAP